MKKTIYFLAMLGLFSACMSNPQADEHQDAEPTETVLTDSTTVEVIEADTTAIEVTESAYMQSHLAYLVDGELYFHDVDDNKKTKFVEEPEAIFNFTFDTEGRTLYYNVERDGLLWLKSADISTAAIAPEWVFNWKLKKDKCITETYFEISPLLYHKGELLMQHDFSWSDHDFEKIALYSVANKKITRKEAMTFDMQKYTGVIPSDNVEEYFEMTDQALYYTYNNSKAALSNKLDFSSNEEENEDDMDIHFSYFFLSPNKAKVLFGTTVAFGDLAHGPFSISNVDGSNQMMLEQTDIANHLKPMWLRNNYVAFTDQDQNLMVANNDKNSTQKVAEEVSIFVAR